MTAYVSKIVQLSKFLQSFDNVKLILYFKMIGFKSTLYPLKYLVFWSIVNILLNDQYTMFKIEYASKFLSSFKFFINEYFLYLNGVYRKIIEHAQNVILLQAYIILDCWIIDIFLFHLSNIQNIPGPLFSPPADVHRSGSGVVVRENLRVESTATAQIDEHVGDSNARPALHLRQRNHVR